MDSMAKTKKLKCLHFVSDLSASSGGTSAVVVQLADALAGRAEIESSILTISSPGPQVLSRSDDVVRREVMSVSKLDLFSLSIRSKIRAAYQEANADIFHTHGLWLPVNHYAHRAAVESRRPIVLQPHGMLEPWAINHKRTKKNIAMSLFQRRDIESAALLVATSDDEYRNIRKLGFQNPIAVIPNGIVFDNDSSGLPQAGPKTVRKALFLSRIHPKKGLINLVRAWASIRPDGWVLQIAGPDEGGHQAEVEAEIGKLNIADRINFIGEVSGNEKHKAYEGADLFVLPTFSENFGLVVAEALSYGIPVITTKGTPWQDLHFHHCGWWIDIGFDPLVGALRAAMALSDEQRREMGKNGRVYVRRYNWQDIACQTSYVYRWLLGRSEKPEYVYLD